MSDNNRKVYAYIDASNLFYGGKKSLGWSIDFEKLYKYLQDRFQASQIFYFGGVEIHKFPFDYLTNETVSLKDLETYLIEHIEKNKKELTGAKLALLDRHLKQVYFYRKLEKFGFQLVLKPVKTYEDEEGNQKRKANCDVEMAFYLMRDKDAFDRVIILSGDGDFLPVLKYLREVGKKDVLVLARGRRTAKEIKRFAGDKFMDFTHNLKARLERIAP
ncbi:MAG: NYN domain-containing protein [Parcubacteria group bacterium]|nr:NYN domain-containing protein [Parcubacteria group bacterium]